VNQNFSLLRKSFCATLGKIFGAETICDTLSATTYPITKHGIISSNIWSDSLGVYNTAFLVVGSKRNGQLLVWKDLLAISAASERNSVLMVPHCKSCEKNLLLSVKPLEEEKGFLVV